MKSHKQIVNWVKNFERFGAEGLMRKTKKESYSVQFKLDVLSFMKRTGSSVIETAGFDVLKIETSTWAIFESIGPFPETIQNV